MNGSVWEEFRNNLTRVTRRIVYELFSLFFPNEHWVFYNNFFVISRCASLCEILRYRWGGCFWFLNMLSVRCTKCQMVPKLPRVKWSMHVFSYVSKMLCIFSSLRVSFLLLDWRMITRKESTKYFIRQTKQVGGGKKFKDHLKNNLTHPPNSSNL